VNLQLVRIIFRILLSEFVDYFSPDVLHVFKTVPAQQNLMYPRLESKVMFRMTFFLQGSELTQVHPGRDKEAEDNL
jgi:hypothetical protein